MVSPPSARPEGRKGCRIPKSVQGHSKIFKISHTLFRSKNQKTSPESLHPRYASQGRGGVQRGRKLQRLRWFLPLCPPGRAERLPNSQKCSRTSQNLQNFPHFISLKPEKISKKPLTNPEICAIITPIKDIDGEGYPDTVSEKWRTVQATDTVSVFVAPESERRNPTPREGLDLSRKLTALVSNGLMDPNEWRTLFRNLSGTAGAVQCMYARSSQSNRLWDECALFIFSTRPRKDALPHAAQSHGKLWKI